MQHALKPVARAALAACALGAVFRMDAVCAADLAPGYPARNVRMVIPFVPGGSSDVIGRMVAQKLTEAWGQQVIVDNRGGGGTVIGTEIVAKATPDGHTILLSTPSFTVNATGVRPLPYQPAKDFTPITLFALRP